MNAFLKAVTLVSKPFSSTYWGNESLWRCCNVL